MSRMLSTLRLPVREASATDVAARASEAAMIAAEAAIRAADAAIKAADAAVRLIDDHDGEVIVLQPAPTPPPGRQTESQLITPVPAGGPFGENARPRWRGRGLGALGLAMVVLGTLALGDAVVTLVWQEPVSALYAKLRQDHLSSALSKEERALPSPAERRALAGLTSERARIAFLALAMQRRARDGSPVGRIRIPRIGASFVVVNGTSTSALESGPGIYRETVFPGLDGTTAIAGHRTTFLAPFRHIDQLRPGNRIMLDMPYAHLTYAVTATAVVAPTDVRAAVDYVGYPRLVLSACTPLFSAAKRLLVFAGLQRASLVQGARALTVGGAGARSGAARAASVTSGARTRSPRPAVRARPAG